MTHFFRLSVCTDERVKGVPWATLDRQTLDITNPRQTNARHNNPRHTQTLDRQTLDITNIRHVKPQTQHFIVKIQFFVLVLPNSNVQSFY